MVLTEVIFCCNSTKYDRTGVSRPPGLDCGLWNDLAGLWRLRLTSDSFRHSVISRFGALPLIGSAIFAEHTVKQLSNVRSKKFRKH